MGAALAFFGICLVLILHRYYTFYASFDQGIFNQVFWNNSHGRLFESSLSSSLSIDVVGDNQIPEVYYHRLGQHFTPALLFWLPFYALFPTAATLSVLQVTLVTAAGIVLYFLARQSVSSPIAAAIAVSYYAANAILGPTLGNFHDSCQLPLFMFGLLLAMEKRWWWLFWVLAGCILMVREDSGVSLFGVGVYLVLSRRYPRVGLAVCALSFGYILVLTNAIMPLFSEDVSRRFTIERFGQYADGTEASTLEIIWGILSKPQILIRELLTPFDRTINYILGQCLPLAFVPVLSPTAWAIAGFPLFKLLIAKGQTVLSINIRYAMTIVPGLFYGAIQWWSQNPERFDKISIRRFWIFCMSLSVIITLVSNPNRTLSFAIPDSIQPLVYVPLNRQWEHARQAYPLLDRIPPDAGVAATTGFIPHLSGRRKVLRLPHPDLSRYAEDNRIVGFEDAAMLVLRDPNSDSGETFRFPLLEVRDDAGEVVRMDYAIADLWHLQEYQAAFKHDRFLLQALVWAIDGLTESGDYGIVDFQDGIILMQQGKMSDPDAVAQWDTFREELNTRSL
ncbi:DUF2079 domain-containing protein [Oscillatoriales cyanobacterium LEGE 11467]|uniref:DUF2079 domain-containing protein n=1 Tax=Zarconia navalis LEGE 11467 TaxID=1828826 RepID=A0A928ZAZ4_9CYAN|nr:DUF2079 domain-containing protein [Zarconia navalis]MBE9042146.1 DUF2079 domain-containing protein [Zarconia navalis LEGE 11467]